MTKLDDGVKRGGKIALMDAQAEQALRDVGAPVRCCDNWPECSHILAWVEKQRIEAFDREFVPYCDTEGL